MNKTEKESGLATGHCLPGMFRHAGIKDARSIQALINEYATQGLMLPRSLNELFETIRQYIVYEEEGKIEGVCGLHISWEDLAEIRALAVSPSLKGRGIGARLLDLALEEAGRLGIPKVFTLTYVPQFFEKCGFAIVDKSDFPRKIWGECVRCHKFPDCDETGLVIDLSKK